MEIWLITYNIEYQPVSHLESGWLSDELRNSKPDFIVIGMQEALHTGVSSSKHKMHGGLGKYIAQERLKYKRVELKKGVYRQRIDGYTKFPAKNCQSFELLRHEDSPYFLSDLKIKTEFTIQKQSKK